MRFPAIQIQQPRRPSAAADFVRRLVTPSSLPQEQIAQERIDTPQRPEVPLDLDQRVRLVGEW